MNTTQEYIKYGEGDDAHYDGRVRTVLSLPPLCEQLRIRDLLDNVAIQVDGSFVAAYELSGLAACYASDEERNRNKTGDRSPDPFASGALPAHADSV